MELLVTQAYIVKKKLNSIIKKIILSARYVNNKEDEKIVYSSLTIYFLFSLLSFLLEGYFWKPIAVDHNKNTPGSRHSGFRS